MPVVAEPSHTQRTLRRRRLVAGVLAIFFCCCLWRYALEGDDGDGDDLAASYIASRLMATGHLNSLYSHDPVDFSAVHDPAWTDAARDGDFGGFLHPYVQTPAWAYLLQPLAMRVSFQTFNALFSALIALCFAMLMWAVAAVWAPALFDPFWIGLIAGVLFLSVPFRYAMFLTQTHVIFVLLSVLGLQLAERRRPVAAGLLVAVAAAVKITPGLLVVYWLLTRRWKAAATFAIASTVILLLTVVAVGGTTVVEYLGEVQRISRLLLVSYNNQSFAAWLMAWWYPSTEFNALHAFHLPAAARWASTALVLGSVGLGGLWDRRRVGGPPMGAMFALVGATIFTPLCWTHYSIVLLVPLMVLLAKNLELHSKTLSVALAAILALNCQPLAMDAQAVEADPLGILRSHFYAGLLCLVALAFTRFRLQVTERQPLTRVEWEPGS